MDGQVCDRHSSAMAKARVLFPSLNVLYLCQHCTDAFGRTYHGRIPRDLRGSGGQRMRLYSAVCSVLEAWAENLRTDTLEREFADADWTSALADDLDD